MSQEPIDTELEEGIPIYLRSSSPKAGHYKVPLPPLATITSSSASTSSSPSSPQLEPVSSSSKHIEPVILSVSRLQVDVSGDKGEFSVSSVWDQCELLPKGVTWLDISNLFSSIFSLSLSLSLSLQIRTKEHQ